MTYSLWGTLRDFLNGFLGLIQLNYEESVKAAMQNKSCGTVDRAVWGASWRWQSQLNFPSLRAFLARPLLTIVFIPFRISEKDARKIDRKEESNEVVLRGSPWLACHASHPSHLVPFLTTPPPPFLRFLGVSERVARGRRILLRGRGGGSACTWRCAARLGGGMGLVQRCRTRVIAQASLQPDEPSWHRESERRRQTGCLLPHLR